MNIFLNIVLFIIGITFGSFYTLAVYRIPKGQDIIHKHSYCPKCKHRLNILDLIPVFSYIFLGGKCRYCKEKIRPRYFILEILSGVLFVALGFIIKLDAYNIELFKVIDYIFFVLYITFAVLIGAIDKEKRQINKSVLMYGIIISIMYMVYLYIIDETSIYRYVIYLVILLILLIFDTIKLKKKAKNSYTYSILVIIVIMTIFTEEYMVINSLIMTLLAISIDLIILKLTNNSKNRINEKQYSGEIPIGFLLCVNNIIFFVITLLMECFIKRNI